MGWICNWCWLCTHCSGIVTMPLLGKHFFLCGINIMVLFQYKDRAFRHMVAIIRIWRVEDRLITIKESIMDPYTGKTKSVYETALRRSSVLLMKCRQLIMKSETWSTSKEICHIYHGWPSTQPGTSTQPCPIVHTAVPPLFTQPCPGRTMSTAVCIYVAGLCASCPAV